MSNSLFSNVSIFDYLSYIKYAREKKNRWSMDFMRFLELKRIMKKQMLTTYYQPIIELTNHEIIGYEALNRPPVTKHFSTTEVFYDYIGHTNQVFQFEMLCRNMSLHNYYEELQKRPLKRDLLIFINIHPQVLVDTNYRSGETLELLQKYNLSPEQIVFELTEKQAVTDYDMLERVLSNYRTQGFRVAIDDAGTGFNSLKTLVHLKPEFIKLDRTLIHNIHSNPSQQKMVHLLVEFANESNTVIIGEGIEQIDDLLFLKDIGVHLGQGYAFGMPSQKLLDVDPIPSQYESI